MAAQNFLQLQFQRTSHPYTDKTPVHMKSKSKFKKKSNNFEVDWHSFLCGRDCNYWLASSLPALRQVPLSPCLCLWLFLFLFSVSHFLPPWLSLNLWTCRRCPWNPELLASTTHSHPWFTCHCPSNPSCCACWVSILQTELPIMSSLLVSIDSSSLGNSHCTLSFENTTAY